MIVPVLDSSSCAARILAGIGFYLSCANFGNGKLELLLDVVDISEGEGGEVVAGVPPDAAFQLLHLIPHPCHLHKYLLHP